MRNDMCKQIKYSALIKAQVSDDFIVETGKEASKLRYSIYYSVADNKN